MHGRVALEQRLQSARQAAGLVDLLHLELDFPGTSLLEDERLERDVAAHEEVVPGVLLGRHLEKAIEACAGDFDVVHEADRGRRERLAIEVQRVARLRLVVGVEGLEDEHAGPDDVEDVHDHLGDDRTDDVPWLVEVVEGLDGLPGAVDGVAVVAREGDLLRLGDEEVALDPVEEEVDHEQDERDDERVEQFGTGSAPGTLELDGFGLASGHGALLTVVALRASLLEALI